MTIKYIIKLLPKPLLIFSLLAMIVSSFDGVVLASIVSNVSNFTKNTQVSTTLVYIGASMLAMLLVYCATLVRQLLENRAIKIMNIDLKANFIFSQIRHSTSAKDAASKVSKIFNDFKLVETNYFTLIFESVALFLTAVVSGIYVLYLNIPIGLLFILFSLLPTIVPKMFEKRLMKSAEKWQGRSKHFLAKVSDLFNGISTIKIYSAEKNIFFDTLHYLHQSEDSYNSMSDQQCWATMVTAVLSIISFLVPLGMGLLFIVHGVIKANVVIGIFLASDRVVGPLRNLVQNLNTMKTTKEIRLSLKKENISFDQKNTQENEPAAPMVTFDNVTFSFPKGPTILQQSSFSVHYLDKMLLTGPSGAGKTTILNLIQGLLKPTAGSVEVTSDGQRVNANSVMTYIQQSPFLFNDTLKFNLTLGEKFTDSDCLDVLRQVGLVNELGSDLLTQNFGEGGGKLSGGQRQRVEIARALLHRKKIILIDEATANLDNEMSKKINAIIASLPCTVIEVAHHFQENDLRKCLFKHYQLDAGKLWQVE